MFSNDFRKLMWMEACELLNQAERLHRQFFRPGGAQEAAAWEPPVDMIETGNGLVIFIALPGVATDQVKVYAEPGCLIVTGRRVLPDMPPRARFQRLEIPYGRFYRKILLPRAAFEIHSHTIVDGCLQLVLKETNP
jgi:HSP20 family molecular chaperone IbpA